MSKKDAKLVNGKENSKAPEISLDDGILLQYLQKNLAIVLADTAQKTAELEKLQKLKKQRLDHKFTCLATASKQPYAKGMNLLPRLNQVNSKASTLVEQLKEQIEAKANVNKAYEKHCKEAMEATAGKLMSRYDQYTAMPDEELQIILDETKNNFEEILDKRAAKKAELITKKKEYHANHFAIKQEIEKLTQVDQDAVERLEQLRLDDVLKCLGTSGLPLYK